MGCSSSLAGTNRGICPIRSSPKRSAPGRNVGNCHVSHAASCPRGVPAPCQRGFHLLDLNCLVALHRSVLTWLLYKRLLSAKRLMTSVQRLDGLGRLLRALPLDARAEAAPARLSCIRASPVTRCNRHSNDRSEHGKQHHARLHERNCERDRNRCRLHGQARGYRARSCGVSMGTEGVITSSEKVGQNPQRILVLSRSPSIGRGSNSHTPTRKELAL